MVVEVGGTDAISVAQKALQVEGFATLDQAFTPDSLRIVERLFDELVHQAKRVDARSRASKLIYDMLPGNQLGASSGEEWDRLEIQHAGALQPVLLDTEVFRQCVGLAKPLVGGSSYSFDHFICKSPCNAAETPWHQDAAFMRFAPSRMGALHFWIPFQDATVDNGCMRFVPGSHRMPLLPHQPFSREKGPQGWRCDSVDNDDAIPCRFRWAAWRSIHPIPCTRLAGTRRICRERRGLSSSAVGGVSSTTSGVICADCRGR
ncbi:phytanoyl-CoA dioxygenase family protein [Sphingomonas aerophila]|uniref:Phytanoyl-CoA dioxygenase n=1 Tax=Sphingomonas aerophila TaxID=1344948 RepID=A0A7W9BC18_9SPHN|nr:phytanoyl-CoA dioxygenase family protein [Sphingomonas aerophila]MBB5714361.1 hypothetical protein [Sphingomonas aerophila]